MPSYVLYWPPHVMKWMRWPLCMMRYRKDSFVCTMAWLRLVDSLKPFVSFETELYKRDYILQKRPIICREPTNHSHPIYESQHIMKRMRWPIMYDAIHQRFLRVYDMNHCTYWSEWDGLLCVMRYRRDSFVCTIWVTARNEVNEMTCYIWYDTPEIPSCVLHESQHILEWMRWPIMYDSIQKRFFGVQKRFFGVQKRFFGVHCMHRSTF